jgi:hypothetical protein
LSFKALGRIMAPFKTKGNMKTRFLCGFAVLFLYVIAPASAQTTQYATITAVNNLPLQPNQLVTLIGYDWGDITSSVGSLQFPIITGTIANGSPINLTPFSIVGSAPGSYNLLSAQTPQSATGLTNIRVGNVGWATFKIETPATATVVSNYVPADAIVVPASATGNVQIILESSPDLVNWTAANPGTYGASAGTNRFFRVRAVATP